MTQGSHFQTYLDNSLFQLVPYIFELLILNIKIFIHIQNHFILLNKLTTVNYPVKFIFRFGKFS